MLYQDAPRPRAEVYKAMNEVLEKTKDENGISLLRSLLKMTFVVPRYLSTLLMLLLQKNGVTVNYFVAFRGYMALIPPFPQIISTMF